MTLGKAARSWVFNRDVKMTESSSAVKRMGEFDLWKMIFALVIVVHHTNLLPMEVSSPLFPGGSIGVEFFFLVSGFLLARSAYKVDSWNDLGEETARFIVKKIKSFFPYMVFAFAVTFVFKALSLDWSFSEVGKNAVNGIVELSFTRMSGLGDAFFNQPTWYLSAMILSMMIIYPLVLKYRGLMTKIIFPIVGCLILGYLFHKYGQFRTPDAWDGWIYKGSLRGFAEVMLGVFCYEVCEWFKRYRFTLVSKVVFTLIEYGSLVFIIAYSNTQNCWNLDCPSILLMMVSVVIAGANVSIFAPSLANSKLISFLGRFSLMLYLNHLYWIYILDLFNLPFTYLEMTALFVVASIVSSIACWAITDLVMRLIRSSWFKRVFLRSNISG